MSHEIAGSALEIANAGELEREWCAQLMAASEPWKTLGAGLDIIRASLTRQGPELFVARRGTAHLGFILLDPFGLAGAPYVKSIAVAPEARGTGIGSSLLRFAEEHFAGRRHLFLCVSGFNQRAQQLYRRTGYEFVAELKDHVVEGHSELLFHKRIS